MNRSVGFMEILPWFASVTRSKEVRQILISEVTDEQVRLG